VKLGNEQARQLLANKTITFAYPYADLEPFVPDGNVITLSPLSADPVVGDIVLAQGRKWLGLQRELLRVVKVDGKAFWLANGKGRIISKAPRRLVFGKLTASVAP
jgi:hypothetical protein